MNIFLYPIRLGLDRHVRIYAISTRQCKRKVYLKQRLNTVVFTHDGDVAGAETAETQGEGGLHDGTNTTRGDNDADVAEDDDTLWAELDAAASSDKKKKTGKHALASSDTTDGVDTKKRRKKSKR